ncbi:hypothetical protein JCM4914_00640 [Streptomyces platensis subsp. malvinus]
MATTDRQHRAHSRGRVHKVRVDAHPAEPDGAEGAVVHAQVLPGLRVVLVPQDPLQVGCAVEEP